MKIKTRVKALIIILMTAAAMAGAIIPSVKADEPIIGTDDGGMIFYLKLITQYTHDTLAAVNNTPIQITNLLEFIKSWLNADTTDTTSNLQASFAAYADAARLTKQAQYGTDDNASSLQTTLLDDFFKASITIPDGQTARDAISKNIPQADSLVYQTLLGQTYLTAATDNNAAIRQQNAYDYIKNAAGLNIIHTIPDSGWAGTADDKAKYLVYYNTISAVQTFNAAVLSELYANYASGNVLSTTQQTLVKQSSDENWFTQIASANLGVVLRQILMYNSQLFVLMTQMYNTEKQILAAQSMTNTLLVLGNQFTEGTLKNNAQEKSATSGVL